MMLGSRGCIRGEQQDPRRPTVACRHACTSGNRGHHHSLRLLLLPASLAPCVNPRDFTDPQTRMHKKRPMLPSFAHFTSSSHPRRPSPDSILTVPSTVVNRMSATNAVQTSLIGLLSSLRMPPKAEAALLSQIAGEAWSTMMRSRVLPLIMPLFTSYLLLPVLVVIKSVARTITFFGISVWLLSSVFPVFLSAIGVTGAGAFVGRTLHTSSFPFADLDVSSVFHNITTSGLRGVELDGVECRHLMACKAGEFVNHNYPFLTVVLRNSGFGDAMAAFAKKSGDRYAEETWSVLLGRRNGTCDDDMDACPGFLRFEALFDHKKREILRNMTRPEEPATTTVSPEDVGGDLVVQAIKSLARANNSSFILNLLS